MSYARTQAIRESAGLLARVNNETPKGTVDGTNRAFVVARRPLVDMNYDDVVDESDVHAFVDGVAVTVESLDKNTGTITLAVAPVAPARVTIDYYHSPITDEYTEGKQQEADDWIDTKIRSYVKTPLNPVPSC